MPSSPDTTEILRLAADGDAEAAGDLVPIVYSELRGMARRFLRDERPDHTLQPTALIHEAYLRLVDQRRARFNDLSHFKMVAAEQMRRVLVDHGRKRGAWKRGRGKRPQSLGAAGDVTGAERPLDHQELDQGLALLEQVDPQRARIVTLKYFGGLTTDEISDATGVSPRTVERALHASIVWLRTKLREDIDGAQPGA